MREESKEERKARLNREATRRWYWKDRDRSRLVAMKKSSNPHAPDGRVPEELSRYFFLKCFEMGGDPCCLDDMHAALAQISFEFPWLQRGYLHPDYLRMLARRYKFVWTEKSPEKRQEILEIYNNSR